MHLLTKNVLELRSLFTISWACRDEHYLTLSVLGILFYTKKRQWSMMKVLTLHYLRVPGFTNPARDYQWAVVNSKDPKPLFLPQSATSSASLSLKQASHHSTCSTSTMHAQTLSWIFQRLAYIDLEPICKSGHSHPGTTTTFIFCQNLFCQLLLYEKLLGTLPLLLLLMVPFRKMRTMTPFSHSFQPGGPQTELVSVNRSEDWPHSHHRYVTWPWSST